MCVWAIDDDGGIRTCSSVKDGAAASSASCPRAGSRGSHRRGIRAGIGGGEGHVAEEGAEDEAAAAAIFDWWLCLLVCEGPGSVRVFIDLIVGRWFGTRFVVCLSEV